MIDQLNTQRAVSDMLSVFVLVVVAKGFSAAARGPRPADNNFRLTVVAPFAVALAAVRVELPGHFFPEVAADFIPEKVTKALDYAVIVQHYFAAIGGLGAVVAGDQNRVRRASWDVGARASGLGERSNLKILSEEMPKG